MATKTVAGIKFTKKEPRVKATLTSDEKLTGAEPNWTGTESGTEYDVKLRDHMFYCNYHYTAKDLKRDVLKYCEKLGSFSKQDLKDLNSSYDSKSKVTLGTPGSLCRAGTRGAPLLEKHKQFIVTHISKLISDWRELKIVPEEQAEKPEAPKVTIQDRLAEKLSEYIGHFDELYDDVIRGKVVTPGSYEFLQANSVPQAQASKIARRFEKYIAELNEAQEGNCAQLKEAYKHYKAKDYQRHIAFLTKIVDDCESYYQVKKTTRKVRVKAAPSKDKLVAKLKFMADDKLLKLVSINPIEILSATELWIYNSATRKLGRYVADEYSKTLSVKGSAIIGFDETKSVSKTLRKPAEQLKDFMKAGKVQLRKYMETIKTTETRLNGRINADTILLKVA
ncbi:hypothetical protein UFOVP116_23 [uncultured Caudovirales phage]|uniref:Uncharacterized protein n=1 Tax=uncultured Caudovirales phage TaxID=2100421 RepID=A0A6J5L4W2_9CAUD|nr:hypothetical protein UFOVP116_23 [uncultured Caudovirales phage]